MTARLRNSPGVNCIEIDAIPFVKPVCGILLVLLLLLMFSISQGNKSDLTERRTSSEVVTQPVRVPSGPTAAELIPALTGGIGSSTSLGGNSSLGGSSH